MNKKRGIGNSPRKMRFVYCLLHLPGGKERSLASEMGVKVADDVLVGCDGGFGLMGVLLSELPFPEIVCKLAGRSTKELLLR